VFWSKNGDIESLQTSTINLSPKMFSQVNFFETQVIAVKEDGSFHKVETRQRADQLGSNEVSNSYFLVDMIKKSSLKRIGNYRDLYVFDFSELREISIEYYESSGYEISFVEGSISKVISLNRKGIFPILYKFKTINSSHKFLINHQQNVELK
jgi:hypothetical protein